MFSKARYCCILPVIRCWNARTSFGCVTRYSSRVVLVLSTIPIVDQNLKPLTWNRIWSLFLQYPKIETIRVAPPGNVRRSRRRLQEWVYCICNRSGRSPFFVPMSWSRQLDWILEYQNFRLLVVFFLNKHTCWVYVYDFWHSSFPPTFFCILGLAVFKSFD